MKRMVITAALLALGTAGCPESKTDVKKAPEAAPAKAGATAQPAKAAAPDSTGGW